MLCKKHPPAKHLTGHSGKPGILIARGSAYSTINQSTGLKNKMDRWFSNFKASVVKHLKSDFHTNAVTAENEHTKKSYKVKS